MSRSRRSNSSVSVWPGFVDALSALLMLVIFMLLIYTVSQLYLSQTLSDRDAELSRLNDRLSEISRLLRLEEERSEMLQEELAAVEETLDVSQQREDILQTEVNRLQSRADADEDRIRELLTSQASLQQDISALRELRAELEQEVAELAGTLEARDQTVEELTSELSGSEAEIGNLRDRTQALRAELASQQERTLLAQTAIDQQDIRIQDLQAIVEEGEQALEEEESLSAARSNRIAQLTRRIEELQEQLRTISAALDLQEEETAEREAELVELGARLNTLLAERVSELEQYQSDFFRRLREALSDNENVRVVGDRFLLPSELLFASGSATLGEDGQGELDALADLILGLVEDIPDDVDWILRVDGHTDQVPINTVRFPSNWELSTARAVSVVRYLAEQGVPEFRMAATGFGEYQPVEEGFSEEALRANRRIELKLTNR